MQAVATERRRSRRRLTVLVASLVAIVATLATAAGVAYAHAELLSSSPANQSLLEASPAEIVLEFSESVDPIDPGIRLVDGDGNEVAIADTDQSLGASTMRAEVSSTLDDGTYVVAWQAVSADSHRVRGAFTFSVGEAGATESGLIEGLFDEEVSGGSDSVLIGIGRFLSYGGIAVLVGVLIMATVLMPSRLRSRRIGTLLWAATAVAAIGTLWMIAAQAHLISGSFTAWGNVADTRSGAWWFRRVVAVVFYGVLMIPLRGRLCLRNGTDVTDATDVIGDPGDAGDPGRSWGLAVPIVLGAGLFAVVAAGGHAIGGDDVALAMAMTIVHLAAMAVWVGSLVLLVGATPRGAFWSTAARLSPWALGSVVALAVTGGVNAWRQLGSISNLTDSTYGRWLVVKLVIVAMVVAVAGVSRWLVRTRSGTDAPALRRTVVVELVGMALVLMATAGLVNSAPPPSAAEIGSASEVVGDRIAQVELDPAVTGGTEMHVYITSPGGGLDRADEITVSAELPAAELGPLEIDTVPAGPNHVIGTDTDLPVPGLWTFEVTARYGDFDQVVFTMQIDVTD